MLEGLDKDRTREERNSKTARKYKVKMAALLNAVASGSLGAKSESSDQVTLQSLDADDQIDDSTDGERVKEKPLNKIKTNLAKTKPGKPRTAWQVTREDVKRLKPEQMRHLKDNHVQPVHTHSSDKSYDPYKNRHKVQKEIIDQQRQLLEEQKRMIEDMQEHQRIIALQKEIATLQQQQKESEKSNVQEKSAVVPPSDSTSNATSAFSQKSHSARSGVSERTVTRKHPIVTKMEERAAERMKRRKELEEMKRKREEERVRKLQEEEERKQREEEEQKQREMEARREAKRLKRKQEEEKKAAVERMKQLTVKADNHYCKTLMKNRGLLPWKRLMQIRGQREQVADFHFNSKLVKSFLRAWREQTEIAIAEREEMADSLNRILLLRRGLHSWKKYGERMTILEQKAELHHNKILRQKYLKFWVDYTTDEKLSMWDKEARADSHNRARMLRRVFNVIRSYRTNVMRAAERRERLQEMRRKVTKILPDFQQPRDSRDYDVTDSDSDHV